MTGWLRNLLIGGGAGVATAAIAAAVYFGTPYFKIPAPSSPPLAASTSSTSPDFTKAAYKVDASGNLVLDSGGNPVVFTGMPHPGDEVEYVLTYKPPVNGTSGPITITDTLSPNQTYVDPSIQAAGWTYTTPPYGTGNQETYSSSGIGAGGSAVLSVTAVSGLSGTQPGSGDGFEPVPVLTSAGVKVFGINHHQPYSGVPHIMCWFGASLTPCAPGYPKDSSTGPDRRATPDFPHAVIYQKKIYFPAGRYNDSTYATLEFGLGCWDAEADTACPFVSLPGSPSLNMSGSGSNYLGTYIDDYLAGLRADPLNPTHAYIYALGTIYCVDLAASGMPACTGWVAPTITPTATAHARGTDLFADENGTRLFFSNTVGAQGTVRCFNFSDGSTCSGWPATGVSGGATYATAMGPGLDANGVMKAVCFSQNFSAPANFRCFDTGNGADITGPAAPSWPTTFLSAAGSIAPYHIPGTKKVLFPAYSNNLAKCYDFSTGAGCTGFAPYWSAGSVRDYGYAVDPVSPQNCIYGLGDGGILVRFKQDGTNAIGECMPKTYTTNFNLNDQFCARKPGQATWTTLDIANRPAVLIGGTITIKDSAGNILQTIAVTAANSYNVNLAATGTSSAVTIEFTPSYSGNTPPATDYQIKLNYTADADPQICYKATIKDCSDALAQGEVTNKAVYTDTNGTKEADVDLGKVTGGHCGPPPCLKLTETIALNPDGTATVTLSGSAPPGFNAVIVNVHSNTPGATVAPPSRTFPPGPFTGTWILSGVTPGESVDLRIDAVDPGAGKNGADQCCSSTMTVVVPPSQPREHYDLGILKTGTSEAQGPANGSGYTYTLSVTNVGMPLNGQSNISITDVVPVGLSFANATGTNWNCAGPFPIAAGGTLTCTYTGSGTLAAGQVLPSITVVSTNAVHGAQLPTITNCANVAFTAGSGLADSNPANDRSCTTNGQQTQTGSLTVVKVVNPMQGHAIPAMTFLANVSCVPPGGSAAPATLALNQADSFTQIIAHLLLGTVCSISEQPPALPSDLPASCRWVTTYPDGQQAAISSGNVTTHIVNTEDCSTQPSTGTTVIITKKPVIDGKPNYRPGVAFPIHASCTAPDGAIVDLSFTAAARTGFNSPKQSIAPGSRCKVHEPSAPLPSGRHDCRWVTSYAFNDSPVASFPVKIGARAANIFEVKNVLDCEEPPPVYCDPQTARAAGGTCACLYPGMLHSRDANECRCPIGTVLRQGMGCVPQRQSCNDPAHWNGYSCTTCAQDEQWNERTKICEAPPLTCHAPLIPDAAGQACVCPQGTKRKNGECQTKRGSLFDRVFDNVHVGVGAGGGYGQRHGGNPPQGHTGTSQPRDNDDTPPKP